MIPFLSIPLPMVVAIWFGLRAGRDDPQTRRDFAIGAIWALAWAGGIIFAWHCLWITSMLPAPWYDTMTSGFYWTLGTAAFWVPILMITYVLRGLIARRQ